MQYERKPVHLWMKVKCIQKLAHKYLITPKVFQTFLEIKAKKYLAAPKLSVSRYSSQHIPKLWQLNAIHKLHLETIDETVATRQYNRHGEILSYYHMN